MCTCTYSYWMSDANCWACIYVLVPLHRSCRVRLANKCRIERSVEVDNLSESDGSESECTQDSNRESSLQIINSSILAGLKHGSAACLLASAPLNSTIFHRHWFTLSMVAIRVNKRACHFDVASIPFKCHFNALM